MDFVWMKHADVQPAKVPASAVPHWEGNGWERCDPPPKPPRPARTVPSRIKKVTPAETSAESAVDTRASAKPKPAKPAPTGRKED